LAIAAADWQQLSPVQGPTSPQPVTVASAATIVPTTFLTVLTGNVAITAITPPVTHGHMLAIQFAGAAGITAGNNITTTKASVAGEVMLLVYNPITAKYVPVG
jgi:hypothetical protein